MKIKGKKVSGRNIEYVIIPRQNEKGESEDIVFYCQSVIDFEPFRKLCPEPKPPQIMKRGEGLIEDVEDPQYKEAVKRHNENRMNWLVLESLKGTPDLEWESVQAGNSDTWNNYQKELRESGIGEFEINRIIQGVLVANSLDERKMEEARKRFLQQNMQVLQQSSYQTGELTSTLSGVPANGSV